MERKVIQRVIQPQRAAQPAAQPTVRSDRSWMRAGSVARALSEAEMRRAAEERERRRAIGLLPFRFWIRPAEQADIIILDATAEDACFLYEHHLRNPATGKWDVYEPCPKEWEPCPLCAQYGDSVYMMFLTILDLRPYTRKDGRVVQHTKKLLALRPTSHQAFFRLSDRHGGLRGVHLLMSRDTDKTTRVGMPEFVAKYDEQDLVENFGHPPETDQAGNVIKTANWDITPYDYGLLFRKPSAEDLRLRYGGSPVAGSRAFVQQNWSQAAPAEDEEQSEPSEASEAPVQPVAPRPVPPKAQAPQSEPVRAGSRIVRSAKPAPQPAAEDGDGPVDLPDDEIPF